MFLFIAPNRACTFNQSLRTKPICVDTGLIYTHYGNMRVEIDLLNTSINWRIVAQFFDRTTKTNWALMQRQRESKSSDWINFRFCILGSVRRKRSYDFAWSSKEQRLTRVEGAFRLQSEFPDLHRCLINYLSTGPLQDAAAKDIRISSAKEALERLRASTPFDRAN